jgi:hypothetical protein
MLSKEHKTGLICPLLYSLVVATLHREPCIPRWRCTGLENGSFEAHPASYTPTSCVAAETRHRQRLNSKSIAEWRPKAGHTCWPNGPTSAVVLDEERQQVTRRIWGGILRREPLLQRSGRWILTAGDIAATI